VIVKDEGIVLKSFDYRETSRIATFFTQHHGRVSGVLKGIRKDHKKFGSNIDRFSINEIVYYEYSRSDLHLISQCDLKQYYFPIREDYKKSLAANYILELVDIIMPSQEPNEKIYILMKEYLKHLESAKDIDKLVHIFQIKILGLSGFRPHIDSCVKCQKQVVGRVRFSLASGGLVCANCPTIGKDFAIISNGTVSTMLHIERSTFEQALRLGLPLTIKKELKYVLNNFLVYHLEKRIKSAEYL